MSTITLTPPVQVKITLPAQLQTIVQAKASHFGLTVSSYIRHLVINDAKNLDYPIHQASQQTENAYQKAKIEEENNELTKADNIDDFLNNL